MEQLPWQLAMLVAAEILRLRADVTGRRATGNRCREAVKLPQAACCQPAPFPSSESEVDTWQARSHTARVRNYTRVGRK